MFCSLAYKILLVQVGTLSFIPHPSFGVCQFYVCKRVSARISSGGGGGRWKRIGNESEPPGNAYEQMLRP